MFSFFSAFAIASTLFGANYMIPLDEIAEGQDDEMIAQIVQKLEEKDQNSQNSKENRENNPEKNSEKAQSPQNSQKSQNKVDISKIWLCLPEKREEIKNSQNIQIASQMMKQYKNADRNAENVRVLRPNFVFIPNPNCPEKFNRDVENLVLSSLETWKKSSIFGNTVFLFSIAPNQSFGQAVNFAYPSRQSSNFSQKNYHIILFEPQKSRDKKEYVDVDIDMLSTLWDEMGDLSLENIARNKKLTLQDGQDQAIHASITLSVEALLNKFQQENQQKNQKTQQKNQPENQQNSNSPFIQLVDGQKVFLSQNLVDKMNTYILENPEYFVKIMNYNLDYTIDWYDKSMKIDYSGKFSKREQTKAKVLFYDYLFEQFPLRAIGHIAQLEFDANQRPIWRLRTQEP